MRNPHEPSFGRQDVAGCDGDETFVATSCRNTSGRLATERLMFDEHDTAPLRGYKKWMLMTPPALSAHAERWATNQDAAMKRKQPRSSRDGCLVHPLRKCFLRKR